MRKLILAIAFLMLSSSVSAETLLIENFEHNTDAIGLISETNGTIATSSTVASGGIYSCKTDITTAGGAANSLAKYAEDFGATIHGRFRYYATSGLVATMDNDNEYVEIFSIYNNDISEMLVRFTIYRTSGANRLVVFYNLNGVFDISTNVLPSSDAWHTITFDFYRHATDGTLTWTIDGVSQGIAGTFDTGDSNSGRIYYGSVNSTGMTGAYYIDDVILDSSKEISAYGWTVQQGGAVGSSYQF